MNRLVSIALLFLGLLFLGYFSWLVLRPPFSVEPEYRPKEDCTKGLAMSSACYTPVGEWNPLGEVSGEAVPKCGEIKTPVAACSNTSPRGSYSTQTEKYCCGPIPA
ncbi:MAG: hypothetical protein V1817_01335 [Candidatus Micrarchaeota archaeon]